MTKIRTTIHRDWRSKERKEKMKIEIEGEIKEQRGRDVTLKKGAVTLNEITFRKK